MHTPKNQVLSLLPILLLTCGSAAASTAGSPFRMTASPAFRAPADAIRRDIGLDAEALALYAGIERAAIITDLQARARLGGSYAGGWLERDAAGAFRMVVATTDRRGTSLARAAGADDVRTHRYSLRELESAMREFDEAGKRRRIDPRIASWRIDLPSNSIIVTLPPDATEAAVDFIAAGNVDTGKVRFEYSGTTPQTFGTINNQMIGGYRYDITGLGSCSIGFAVERAFPESGFVTAGHCGGAGMATTGLDGIGFNRGTVAASTFPGSDFAWVRSDIFWFPRPWVSNYAGGMLEVLGSNVAPPGAMVCRSGATTGFRCGTVTSTNVTVNYGPGPVSGLTQSTACAGRGDSGGAFITPAGQAQGVTSGGQLPGGADNNCGVASPVTYHQPLQPILAAYGLTLLTTANGSSSPSFIYDSCSTHGPFFNRMYTCNVEFVSAQTVTLTWFDTVVPVTTPGRSTYSGRCTSRNIMPPVSIMNQSGSSTMWLGPVCP